MFWQPSALLFAQNQAALHKSSARHFHPDIKTKKRSAHRAQPFDAHDFCGIRAISMDLDVLDILERDFAETLVDTKIFHLRVSTLDYYAPTTVNGIYSKLSTWLISRQSGSADAPKLLLICSSLAFKIELFHFINKVNDINFINEKNMNSNI